MYSVAADTTMAGKHVKLETAAIVVKKSLLRMLNSGVTHMYSGTKARTANGNPQNDQSD